MRTFQGRPVMSGWLTSPASWGTYSMGIAFAILAWWAIGRGASALLVMVGLSFAGTFVGGLVDRCHEAIREIQLDDQQLVVRYRLRRPRQISWNQVKRVRFEKRVWQFLDPEWKGIKLSPYSFDRYVLEDLQQAILLVLQRHGFVEEELPGKDRGFIRAPGNAAESLPS